MAILSLNSVSPRSRLWKAAERPVSEVANPVCFPSRSSPFQYQSLTSTSSSAPGCNSRANKIFKCKSPVSMSLQMEEVATAGQSELDEIPTVVEFTIPPESLAGFEADYGRVSGTWASDLASTTDDAKIEQFVASAHALARRWLPEELVARLESFLHDPTDPPALVIRGLPIDKELPPTGPDVHVLKAGQCVSETWLIGIGRIVGQVFTFSFHRGSRGGMGLLVREIYTTAEKVEQVSAEGSRELLDFHMDFPQVLPEKFPHVIAFLGIRGAANRDGKTLLCNNRKLYKLLDPADIEILRTEKIHWEVPMMPFTLNVIQGSESNPKFCVFEENVLTFGGFENLVKGSPEARAAYKRVKEAAATLAEGVYLEGGDLLLLNQKKATHGRSPYTAKYDGNDRWLQRVYINSGGFWESGVTEWPSRTLPSL